MSINLIVNEKPASVDVSGDTPLLWVLRDVLNLHGTKYGCGIGQCGACTVHVNGQPMRSCSLQVADAANKKITTIEGLSPDNAHPLQRAWLDVDVPQCGYCQAGQIMSAAALLSKTPKPTDQQIDAAMDGNLCRCGTYVRVREAIHKASSMMNSAKGSDASRQERNEHANPWGGALETEPVLRVFLEDPKGGR